MAVLALLTLGKQYLPGSLLQSLPWYSPVPGFSNQSSQTIRPAPLSAWWCCPCSSPHPPHSYKASALLSGGTPHSSASSGLCNTLLELPNSCFLLSIFSFLHSCHPCSLLPIHPQQYLLRMWKSYSVPGPPTISSPIVSLLVVLPGNWSTERSYPHNCWTPATSSMSPL